jgi:hypothetical protein
VWPATVPLLLLLFFHLVCDIQVAGVAVDYATEFVYLFDSLCGAAVGKNRRKGYQLIWHAIVWLIWKARNDIIFNNEIKDERAVVEGIKVLSWHCSLASLNLSPCLLYEWCAEPNLCLDM